MSNGNRGKFIVIEGGEGAGKTTMIKAIHRNFPDVVVSREPGGAPLAEKIRDIILSPDAGTASAKTQFALFWAARADHMENTVIPALRSGKHVVTDRFDGSSFAYQIHGQQNSSLEDLFFEMRQVYLGEWPPDMYVFLDVLPEEGLRRRASEKGNVLNHFDQRNLLFHERIYRGYQEFLPKVPHRVIDARPALVEVEPVFLELIRTLLK
jgi:dTMP kinase